MVDSLHIILLSKKRVVNISIKQAVRLAEHLLFSEQKSSFKLTGYSHIPRISLKTLALRQKPHWEFSKCLKAIKTVPICQLSGSILHANQLQRSHFELTSMKIIHADIEGHMIYAVRLSI